MTSVAVLGASGYAGIEVTRLVAQHPDLVLSAATGDSQAGVPIAALYPHMGPIVGNLEFAKFQPNDPLDADVAVVALPHGASMGMMESLLGQVRVVVDLGADFRISDPAEYKRWYGAEHTEPALLADAVYSITEFCRDRLPGARLIANPGCYPTAASLALAPLVRAGLLDNKSVIVDAASGVSGAGRPPKSNTTFCTVNEDFTAYGLLNHRHTVEMESVIGASVLFTPHLAPMNRGILATCYGRPTNDQVDTAAVMECLRDAYDHEPFVHVIDSAPSTKSTLGSNNVMVTAAVDPRTGWVIVISALDNLIKGAAGQAIQNLNVALGLEETAGLPLAAVYP